MKILAITPIHVGGDERRRRQARYDRLAPAHVSIDLRDLPPAAPRSLESDADIRRSEKLVADAIATLLGQSRTAA